jgi:nucleoside-diphosphate-sugar epimerase
MSRVLLTGATGLIGSRTIAPLLQAGHEVHAFSRGSRAFIGDRGVLSDEGRGSLADGDRGARSDVHWHAVDLLDPEATCAAVHEVQADALLHFAWYAEHGRFWESAENLPWVGATLNLLRLFGEAGGARAVLAGSCAEYEWGGEGICSEVGTPLRPATLYGTAKHATQMVASAYAKGVGIQLAWGRIFLCYGPGEDERRLVPSVTRALLAGDEAEVSDGEQLRDLMHVDDVARAFVALLDSTVSGAINIASGEEVRLAEVIALIAAEVGRPELVRLGALPRRESDPPKLLATVSRLREGVGFERQITLEQGIRDTVTWWREWQR